MAEKTLGGADLPTRVKLNDSWLVKIYPRRRHAPTTGILISKDIKIPLLVQDLQQFCLMGGFFLLDKVVKLVRGESVINGAYPV